MANARVGTHHPIYPREPLTTCTRVPEIRSIVRLFGLFSRRSTRKMRSGQHFFALFVYVVSVCRLRAVCDKITRRQYYGQLKQYYSLALYSRSPTNSEILKVHYRVLTFYIFTRFFFDT